MTEAGANPVKDGLVSNWEAMEQLWRETCLDNLRVSPEGHPILLTETLKFTKEDREMVTKIFFDKLNVPCFYLANSAVLSLYATGRVSGLAIIVEEESTSVVPVYQSIALDKGAQHNVSNDEIAEAACNAIMRSNSEQRLEMFRNILVVSVADASSNHWTLLTTLIVRIQLELVQRCRQVEGRASPLCCTRARSQHHCPEQR